jgi:sugar fermentation stimulation protein A
LPPTFPGRLVRRYQRFFAEVATERGLLTVHCPNPGRMLGLLEPGSPVRLSTSANPERRLAHTLEMIRVDRTWVGLNTLRANAVARAAFAGGYAPFAGYRELRREVRHGGSRIDFHLVGHDSAPDAFVEVKSATLSRVPGVAEFPDAVTERGYRHVKLLERLARRGARAALLFVVQRADCERVTLAEDLDPDYARALRRAAARGVEVAALGVRVDARCLLALRALPVVL